MAMKNNLIIKDENLNEEYVVVGQSGIYIKDDYKNKNQPYLLDKDKTHRFVLIDLWQLATFGAENVKQEWDTKEEKYCVTEENINNFVEEAIRYITDYNDLFNIIKNEIIDEINNNEEQYLVETIYMEE